MPIKALILLTLLSRTPHHRDTETWEQRTDRMELVADAIGDAASKATCTGPHKGTEDCKVIWPGSAKSLSMLLVGQGVFETHLSHLIHDNQCRLRIGECDATRTWSARAGQFRYYQRSFSLWQLKRFRDVSQADWKEIELGRAGTHAAAWLATRRLSGALVGCGSIEGAISRYATGNACEWEDASKRYALYKSLMSSSPRTLKERVRKQEARVRSRDEVQAVASRD